MDLSLVAQCVVSGQASKAKELVLQALKENVSPSDILKNGLIRGMGIVGEMFKKNEVFIPEVLVSARCMKAAMEILKPALVKSGANPCGKIAIGTVKGDLHDIGKNLVAMMMEGGGFEVLDLGIDVGPEKFINTVQEKDVDVVGLSALLTTTMPMMKVIIDELNSAGLRTKVKILVGGAPVTQEYADEIGADGYAPDAASAVDKAKTLINLN